MIKFTEDQLAIIEIIGYTPKLIKNKEGKSVLMLDLGTLTKEQTEDVFKIIRGEHHMTAFRKEQDRKLMFGNNE